MLTNKTIIRPIRILNWKIRPSHGFLLTAITEMCHKEVQRLAARAKKVPRAAPKKVQEDQINRKMLLKSTIDLPSKQKWLSPQT